MTRARTEAMCIAAAERDSIAGLHRQLGEHLSAMGETVEPMPELPLVTTQVRQLDDNLWRILTKPGPLTAEEWAFVEAREAEEERREMAEQHLGWRK